MYRAFEVLLEGALDAAIGDGDLTIRERPVCRLEAPADPAFGDATSRVALAIARRTGRPPEPVARLLVGKLDDPEGWLERVEAGGPGFVNFRASLGYWRAVLAARVWGPPPATVSQGRAVVVRSVPDGLSRAGLVADAIVDVLAATGHAVSTITGTAEVLTTVGDAVGVGRVVVVDAAAEASTARRAKASFACAGGRAGVVTAIGVAPLRVRHRGRPLAPEETRPVLAEPAARFALLNTPPAEPAVLDVERLASDRIDNPWVGVRYALERIARVGGRAVAGPVALERLGEPERECLRELGLEPDVRDGAARRLEIEALTAHARRLAGAFHRYYNRGAYDGADAELARARRALACGVGRTLEATLAIVAAPSPVAG